MSDEWSTVSAARAREARAGRAQRKARGVVHTPAELASWALARVQCALVEELGIARGLGDAGVTVLDPAVGTGIWLDAALEHAGEGAAARRWLGFDVDEEALATTRGLLAARCEERSIALELRAENTLANPDPWPPGEHVRVVVGNPPWATRSMSRGTALSDGWLRDFMRDGRGEPLKERRSGVLSDDYVRFFRWALEQARGATQGAVVCLATNSSFLDGPVHRGMRARLLEAFDRIEVLDLGGNALLSAAGERDDNLFGVRVGAAVTLLVRRPESGRGAAASASVQYQRLRGSRDHKREALRVRGAPPARAHVPLLPLLTFTPRDNPARAADGFSLDEAFPFHREGLQTNRDAIAIASDRAELETRLRAIADGSLALTASRHFSPQLARERLRAALEQHGAGCIVPVAYRPLVARFACVVPPLCHRPRPELRAALAHTDFALASVRKDRGQAPFELFAPTRLLTDACFLSTRSSCRTRLFPACDAAGQDNLSPAVREQLGERLGTAPSARDVLAYTLAVLASHSYRVAAGDSLKHDYPRVPWPSNLATFHALVTAGQRLDAALHEDVAPCVQLHPDVAPGTRLSPDGLALVPDEGVIKLHGRVLLEGLSERAMHVRIGHQPLIATALKVERQWSLPALVQMVSRATCWAEALDVADARFRDAVSCNASTHAASAVCD